MSESSTDCRFHSPEIKLEDVREGKSSNTCCGRGRETASSRGYNAERLAHAVFSQLDFYYSISIDPWHDDIVEVDDELVYWIEVKSCVDRYQTAAGEEGRYGQFRVWKHHHDRIIQSNANSSDSKRCIYFFVVYTIEDGIEKEIGKLVAPVQMVDGVINTWISEDHVSMGEKMNRQISWRLLLKKLGVSRERFENEHIIDLLDE